MSAATTAAASLTIRPQVADHDNASFAERFETLARLQFAPSGVEVLAEQTTGEDSAEETMQSAVWMAGCVLADVMQQPSVFGPEYWRGKRVLELGAGCGVAGLLAAKLGAMVFLTDLAPLVPLLERNAKRNGVEQRTVAREIEWGCEDIPDVILMPRAPDVILGSDITPF
eukprot:7266938-Prymnesium_polylepis.1